MAERRMAHDHPSGRSVALGGPRLLEELKVESPSTLTTTTDEWSRRGRTVLHVIVDGRVAGALGLEDEIRPESRAAVDQLHRLGVKVALVTGDSQAVADSVGKQLGIDEVAAQVLPADKAATVRRFQLGGRRVAMVGDGVNDAPALATADVAVEAGGIVLVGSDPRDVVSAIELSRASYRKMRQNLAWATGYNVVAIPVAAGLLAPWGFVLPMALGALAMSASTVIVALNAQLLRRLRLSHSSPIESAAEKGRAPTRVGALRCGLIEPCWASEPLCAAATEAVVAVDRLAARRPERHHRRLATVGAGGLEHLARTALAVATSGAAGVATHGHVAAARHRSLARGATAAASAGVAEPTICIELLLARREDELLAAIGAGQRSIDVQKEHSFSGRTSRLFSRDP